MFSNPSTPWPRLLRSLAATFLITVAIANGGSRSRAAEAGQATGPVLTSFEQIWQLSEAEQREWHRVSLDFVVYYYDPLWAAMWGRCGEADSYLSLGTKVFPIKAGQRIRVEGRVQPSGGMRVDDPKVTVLAESAPVEVLSTAGQVAATERFNKRLVTLEGYVDRQAVRDSNHLEIFLVTEGRPVLLELLLSNDAALPQLKGSMVRAKGVYFARNDPFWTGPRIELWVQRSEDINVIGTLERDPRFEAPPTPIAKLDAMAGAAPVHVAGRVVSQEAGATLTIRDDTGVVTVRAVQSETVLPDESVEAVGFPAREGSGMVLRDGLFRLAQATITSARQLWALTETERQKWHSVRIDFLVYYYDPLWKTVWGRAEGSDDYLSFGSVPVAIKPGQMIRIEGSVRPTSNVQIIDPKITVLAENEPMEVITVHDGIGDAGRLNKHLVVAEGYVDRQVETDPNHAELDLVTEGRQVIVRLLVKNGETVPHWEGALLRAKGVYSATNDPTGGLPTIELWTQSLEDVAKIGALDDDDRLKLPKTAIDRLPVLTVDTPVRVVGAVQAQRSGKSLTIRDETGQLVFPTVQTRAVQLGGRVEAIGFVTHANGEVTLREALYRQTNAAVPVTGGALATLRVAEQVRQLSAEEAGRGYPVRLNGTITWADPAADFFFVSDVSGGVCVFRPPDFTARLWVGARVDVDGTSAAGKFTPVVFASNVRWSAIVDLPEAKTVTLEQALTGIEEAQWVSMSGYVREVVHDGPWIRLELTTSAGDFTAVMSASGGLPEVRGAVVRVRGVCSALTNSKRQLIGVQLWVPSAQFVEVEEAEPANPFTVPLQPIAGLRQFGSLQELNRRVRVRGVVIHQEPGRLVNIQDGNEGLVVLSRDTTPLALGDRIEAVGFPGRENSRLVLREAVYQRVAVGAEPPPVAVANLASIDAELDGRLARIEGRLLDVGGYEKGTELIVQNGATVFEAQVSVARTAVPSRWVPGSRVALTGIYQIEFDEYRRPHDVQFQLRSPQDVVILERPPWWTARRALAVTGAVAVVGLLVLGWAFALRRRVQVQTGVISQQIEKEKEARLEAALARASKLESLGVLAGGIAHDFNNLLTVIIGNVSLAKLDPHIETETTLCLTESERAAARARDLTQQLLTFAKGGAPVREATRLPDVVREAAQFALHGSKVRCEFEIAPDLWAADVDRGQIGQVVHNIIINANQAMPGGGLIRIALHNEEVVTARSGLAAGRYVKLSFADTGSGIKAENLPRIFEPYFTTKKHGSGLGLATVYSIVTKHEGHVEATSTVGQGTMFHVWLPAVAAEAPAGPAAAETGGAARPSVARVLLMDDEAPIRMMAGTILKRLGFAVTAVADGSEVVSEYAAARVAGRPYDLVILDLTVAGAMGGAEAMEKLRAMDPNVRAVVSSGYSSDPVMANYRAYGFSGRAPKPYTATDLKDVITAVMQGGQI